jgi:hypothetical protein
MSQKPSAFETTNAATAHYSLPFMRTPAVALCLTLAVFASGCGDLLSLHALSSPSAQVWDPAIEGRWINDDQQLDVRRVQDHYDVILHFPRNPDEPRWEVTLTDLNGVRIADLLPPDTIGHMFAKVQVSPHELRLAFLDSEWLRQRVPHEEADLQDARKQAVLTAPTPQLRRMLSKFARDPRAYDSQEHVWRK